MKKPMQGAQGSNPLSKKQRTPTRRSGILSYGWLAALPLVSAIAHANSELPSFTEEDLFADIPQVVSATRLSQKLTEAPAAMTVIDRQQIEASGSVQISDLLRLVPGMQAYHVTRNKMAATYHGLSNDFPNRMEVMINGRSIYLPLLSTVAWETIGISLDDIERIEVVRGSNVPTQGSNAFLGSINIITRSPLSQPDNSAQMMSGYGGEERAEWRHTVSGEQGDLRISTGFSQNDGSNHYQDQADNRYLYLHAVSALSLRDTLELEMGFSSGTTDVVGADSLTHLADPREHDTNYQYLTWSRLAGDNQEYQLTFYHNYLDLNVDTIPVMKWLVETNEYSVSDANAILNFVFPDLNGTYQRPDSEHGTSEQYDLEFQHTYFPTDSLKLVSGVGYRFEQAKSDVLLDSEEWIREERARAFAHAQWNATQKLIWNLGAMHENTTVADSRTSTRIAANYLLDDETSFRFAHSRAYRMPSLLESNTASNIYGRADAGTPVIAQIAAPTANLQAEKIQTSEFGFYKLIPSHGAQFDLRVFREEVSNGIYNAVIDADPNYSDTDNRRDTKANTQFWETNGFEFQFKVKPSPDSLVSLNYTHFDVEGEYYKRPGEVWDLSAYAPEDTASLLLYHRFAGNWDASLAHYIMGSTRWLEGTSGKEVRKAYQRTDLQLRKRFPLSANTDAQLRLIVQNLFDDQYQEFYQYNYFDRRAYVEFKLLY